MLQRGYVIAELHGDQISSEHIEEIQLVPLGAADVLISTEPGPDPDEGAHS